MRRSRPTCCARFDQDLIQGVRKPFVQTPSDAITQRRAIRSFTGYWKVDEIGVFFRRNKFDIDMFFVSHSCLSYKNAR